MAIESVAAFIELLRNSGLIDPARLDQITRGSQTRFTDPGELARYLLHRGWLTPYQVDQLMRGHGQNLMLGPYRLIERLGEGGVGQVFKALHLRMNRVVALKFIRKDLLAVPHAIHRFYREVQAVAQLSHPNIVMAYDADEVGNTHFFAMEFVDGIDLFKLVQQSGPLPLPLACDCIRQAARGLQHAFERGMVHRDVKPANLMVSMPSGTQEKVSDTKLGISSVLTLPSKGFVVKVLDMGLARLAHTIEHDEGEGQLTQQGTVIGTPDYIAPEQALDSRTADIRADIYSLGCTFYFLLTGQPPFPGGSIMKKLLNHQQAEPTPIEQLRTDCPRGLALVIRKMMAKRPQDRYQTPAQVDMALGSFAKPDEPNVRSVLRGHADWVRSVAYSPDGSTLATGDGDGAIRLWRFDKGKEEPIILKKHAGNVYALAYSPNGKFLASGCWDRTVRLWDVSQPVPIETAVLSGHMSWVRSVAYAPDGKTLASGGADLTIRLWDLSCDPPKEKLVIQGNPREIRALAFAPDGKTLASGSWDCAVRLWDLTGDKPKKKITLTGHTEAVLGVAYSPDGTTLASVSHDKTVRLYDVTGETPAERAVLRGHLAVVYAVAFSPDSRTLVTGSYDGQLILWDNSSGKRLGKWTLPGPVYGAAYSPDGKQIAVGTSTGNGHGTAYVIRAGAPDRTTRIPS